MNKTRANQLRTIYQGKPTEDLMAPYKVAQRLGTKGAADHMKIIEEIVDERGDL